MYIYRQLGQLFMMGFDGTSVNPQIRALIEDYRVGSVLLTAKNLKCAFIVRTADDFFC
jgi:beta-N-acetylhexosaminidase